MVLGYILASVLLVSVLSLVGVVTFLIKPKLLQKILFVLVSFAAGAMLGAAFLDLLPEAIKHSPDGVFGLVLLGIVIFFVLETFVYWYHCHGGKCDKHKTHLMGYSSKKHSEPLPVAYLNLIGDGVHNFLDGVIIATAYLVNIPLGIVTTLAVIFHEIPQEIGDFGILIYSGFTRFQALAYNFLSALMAVAGAVLAFFFASTITNFTQWLVPIAAGGFIYIAAVDLLPELHQTKRFDKAMIQLCAFLAGIFVIWAVTKLFVY